MKNHSPFFAPLLRRSTLALAGLLGLGLAQPAAAAPAKVQLATGNALAFDGTDNYVALPSGLTNGLTNFTFETWINYQDTGAYSRIFDFGNSTNTWMVFSPRSNYPGNSGNIFFGIRANSGSGEQDVFTTTPMPTGWHHLALTLAANGGGTHTGRIYLDGALIGTNAGMTLSMASLGNLTNNWLGRSEFSFDPYLKAKLDEVRMYNVTLSQAQVQNDMNSTSSALPANQLAYYDFDQGTASGNNAGLNTLLDRTANGRNGTLNSFDLTGSTSNWVAAPNALPVSIQPASTTPTGYQSATSLGGLTPVSVVYAANGDQLVLGYIFGSVTLGATTLTSAGAADVVIARRSAAGTWLWASRAGGTNDDYVTTVRTDGNGDVFIAGFFASAPASFGATSLSATNGSFDGYVAKVNGSTGAFVWSTKVSGSISDSDIVGSLAVNSSGDVFATGIFVGTAVLGGNTITSTAGGSAFVTKISGSTGSFLWATAAGGDSAGNTVDVNSVGDLAISGSSRSSTSFGAAGTLSYSGGTYDGFVAKMTSAGAWVWVKKIAGSNQDGADGMAFNAADDIFVVGHFGGGSASADGIPLTSTSGSLTRENYVAKFDGASGAIRWALAGGGTGGDHRSVVVVVDAAGNAVIGGVYNNSATFGSTTLTSTVTGTVFNGFTARVKDNGTSGSWDWALKVSSNIDARSGAVAVNKATGEVIAATGANGTHTYQGVAGTVPAGGSLGFIQAPYTAGTLTISGTGQMILPGLYNDLTIVSGADVLVKGPIVVNGSLNVAGTLTQPFGNTIAGAGSFALNAGGTLSTYDVAGLSASGRTGGIRTDGSRSFSTDATYAYSGPAAQVTGAGLPTIVRGLTVNNSLGLTLSQAVGVTQLARLQSGNLTTGGNTFTLRSVRGQGSAVLDNTGGVVSGTATVQRAVDATNGSNIGYHHYSAPVSNTTLADLTVPGAFVPVFSPSYNTAISATQVRPFPTVFGYDERRLTPANGLSGTAASSLATDLGTFEKGYFSPAAADAWPVGHGYTANVPNAAVVDFVGTLNNSTVTITGLSRGASVGSPDQAGWQLLGNPYPSPLDWSTVTTAQRTNMDAAMYVFQATDTYAGTYRTYLSSGTGVPNSGIGAEPLIGSGAGFFARVTAPGTGALNLTNTNRVTTYGSQPAFGRQASSARALLTLQVTGTNVADELHVYTDANATAGVDAQHDAVKMSNPNGLTLAALAGNTPLAIDGLPTIATTTVVPLTLAAPTAGTYAFAITALANFGSTRVYLRDAVAGTETLLTTGTAVPVALASVAASTTRFSLVFRPAGALATASNALAAQASVYPNPASGQFTLLLPPVAGATAATATLVNTLGQVVNTRTLLLTAGGASTEYATSSLAAGIYTLRLQAGNQAATLRVVVK